MAKRIYLIRADGIPSIPPARPIGSSPRVAKPLLVARRRRWSRAHAATLLGGLLVACCLTATYLLMAGYLR